MPRGGYRPGAGRPKGSGRKVAPAREHTLGVRLSPAELAEITAAAEHEGVPDPSTWLRALGLRTARTRGEDGGR